MTTSDKTTRYKTISVRLSDDEFSLLTSEAKQLDRSVGWVARARMFPAEANTSGTAFGYLGPRPPKTILTGANTSGETATWNPSDHQADSHIAAAPDRRLAAETPKIVSGKSAQAARDDILRGVNRKAK